MGTKWNYQIINVKLCYRVVDRQSLFHVIIPEGSRFRWRDFIKLKDYLRSQFKNTFNKDLYKAGSPRFLEDGNTTYEEDQPVFEYYSNAQDLIEAITLFAKESLNLGDYQFSFSTIDYNYITAMKEVSLDMMHVGETLFEELQ